MGVDMLFFANHKIGGKPFKERIANIELRLQKEIQIIPNIPYSKEKEPQKTDKYEEVIFYMRDTNAETFYNQVNEIEINTNFLYLSSVRFFEKTLRINLRGISTDPYNWQRFLGNEYEKKEKSEEYLEYNRVWKEFQTFKYQLLKKFGGDKIIYINDQSFQESEDLFYRGKGLDEVLVELQKTGPIFKIEKLYNHFDEIFNDNNLRCYGFYEDLI